MTMSADAKWIIGTMLGGMVGMTAILVTLIITLNGDVRADLRRMDARLDGFDERLRAVEVAFGKVDQRLATLERLHLPTPADEGD